MVAVESYVKSHYGRGSSTHLHGLPQGGHKSPNLSPRTPLLPTDFDLCKYPLFIIINLEN